MEKNLTYLATMTTTTFKNSRAIERIDVIKSPKTEKIFMADEVGNAIGAVATTIDFKSELVVSEVCGKEEGDKPFFLLHNKRGSDALHSI
jgi:hypothetical protein